MKKALFILVLMCVPMHAHAQLNCSGGCGTANLTATYVGFGDGTGALTGESNFTWNSTTHALSIYNQLTFGSSGDSDSITVTGNGLLLFSLNGSNRWQIYDSTRTYAFQPSADNAYDLCSSTLRCRAIYGVTVQTTTSSATTHASANGTASLPSQTFSNDPDTGFYSAAGNQIGITAGGSIIGRFTGGIILDGTSSYGLGPGAGASADVAWVRTGTNNSTIITSGATVASMSNTGANFPVAGRMTISSVNTSGISSALNLTGDFKWSGYTSTSGALGGTVCIDANNLVQVDTNGGGCLVSNDLFKKDILPLVGQSFIDRMKPVSWTWAGDMAGSRYGTWGFTAQAMAAIDPHFARYDKDGNPIDIDDRAVLGVTVAEVQALKERIRVLEAGK